ncbi:hydrolase, partial [Streptomyces griseoflavus Tu4000]
MDAGTGGHLQPLLFSGVLGEACAASLPAAEPILAPRLTRLANSISFWLRVLAMTNEQGDVMTEYLTVDDGVIAYEVAGAGPLVVLAHGMGDSRAAYRAVIPRLVAAGHRVAAVDLRGCGESGTDWPDWSRAAVAGDLLALIRHLGGPAVLVGHSFSGGAATIAAAREPSLVSAVVELAPFTRKQSVRLGDLKVKRFRRACCGCSAPACSAASG